MLDDHTRHSGRIAMSALIGIDIVDPNGKIMTITDVVFDTNSGVTMVVGLCQGMPASMDLDDLGDCDLMLLSSDNDDTDTNDDDEGGTMENDSRIALRTLLLSVTLLLYVAIAPAVAIAMWKFALSL